MTVKRLAINAVILSSVSCFLGTLAVRQLDMTMTLLCPSLLDHCHQKSNEATSQLNDKKFVVV